ncbi:MAG TPA: tRNA (adenosine(37)-N6)-threonylcarbamoyltransferase complex dimerization subunit type 1 TsaB [Candidatus Polarisedimenticolia bacterium]|jgi:tRNA threonylcarbamoyladenosine biosynthesis protein TsaB|nr:tRNA (adenosine(37)-N6)-threonylcarbamoyltransferase complex dimerization subunit type 1 TsaB [Candidatus Polarisedimenticolia bacterium]
MLILAIDTSGQSGGITLGEADAGSFRVIESAAIAGGTFSAQLIPTLAALLKKHEYRAADIGGFAAASGPGSFTGLRVGLSAIKGLAETLRKPIATVSVLEALASLSDRAGKIAAAIDAGRKEVFLGLYEKRPANSAQQSAGNSDHALVMQHEELLTQQDFLATLETERPAVIIISDAALSELASASHSAVVVVTPPGSEAIARIGARKLLAGDTVSVEALDANYLRRSDAEIFFKGNRRA